MSSEVEVGNEEEGEEEPVEIKKKSWKRVLKRHWNVGIKVLELIIAIGCLAVVFEPTRATGLGKSHLHHVGIMYTAYAGTILINSVILVTHLMGDKLPYRTSVVFSVCGASMFLITATLLIADRSHLTKHYFFHPNAHLMEMLTTSTLFAFVNTVVFIVDAIATRYNPITRKSRSFVSSRSLET